MKDRPHARASLRLFLEACLGSDLECDAELLTRRAAEMTRESWSALPEAADSHGITLAVAAQIQSLGNGCPSEIQAALRERALAHRGAALRARVGLSWMTEVLDSLSGGWALLKGAVLGDYVYRRAGARSYADIDVLVAPSDVRTVLTYIESAGGELITRNWAYLSDLDKREVTVRLPNGSFLDLHWNLLATPSKAPGIHFDTAEMLARRRRIVLTGSMETGVYALHAADQLLHVACHGVLAGFGPLRFSLDLDQSIRHDLPDLDELAGRARASGTSLMLRVAATRSAAALGASPSYGALLQAVSVEASGFWESFMRLNNRLNPACRSHEAFPIQWLAGATRENTSASGSSLSSFAVSRLAALREPRVFLSRLRHGLHRVHMLDVEIEDIDGGRRELMLSRLDSE